MLWALLFVCVVFGGTIDVEQLKRQWRHENYSSFDHYWNSTFGSDEFRPMTEVMKAIEEQRIVCKLQGKCPTPRPSIIGQRTNCVNGNAGGYACDGIDLLAFVSLSDLGSASSADGNDIWGYTDGNGDRYAITGQTDGASIVDVSDPENPVVLVFIQSALTQNTVWRDMKVYNNYVYIVADRSGHGVQYVNLDAVIAEARNAASLPLRLTRGSNLYNQYVGRNTQIGNCHNIAINTDTGFAYAVGSSGASGGLYMYDVSGGVPSYAGSFSSDGYTHDTECIRYNGPDTTYVGREICFGYNENSLTIVDVSIKGSPQMLSRTTYTQSAYTHQGWITDDHQYLLLNDELDESRFGFNTRTLIWDVRSLTNPSNLGYYSGPTAAIDHNLYIEGNLVFEANYRAGLRVLDITDIAQAQLREVAYFKTWTGTITASFNGAWSNYPYFNDMVIVQDIEQGLFILSKTTQPLGNNNLTRSSL